MGELGLTGEKVSCMVRNYHAHSVTGKSLKEFLKLSLWLYPEMTVVQAQGILEGTHKLEWEDKHLKVVSNG